MIGLATAVMPAALVVGLTVPRARVAARAADITPSSAWPHEPAGFTRVLNQPWVSEVFMTDRMPGNHALVRDQDNAPVSPPSAIDFWYPAGLRAGYSEFGKLWFTIPPAWIKKEIFIGLAFKLSDAFQGEASGVQKLYFVGAHGDASNDVWVEVGGSGSEPLHLRVVTEFVGLAAARFDPNRTNWDSTPVEGETDVPITRGVWHKYEVYLKLPDVSGGAGTCQIWVDGILALNRDATLPSDRTMPMSFADQGWGTLYVDPIWGGGGSIKAHRDDIWFDHLYVSVR